MPVAGMDLAHDGKALPSMFLAPRKTLVSSSYEKVILIPEPHSDENQACDG